MGFVINCIITSILSCMFMVEIVGLARNGITIHLVSLILKYFALPFIIFFILYLLYNHIKKDSGKLEEKMQ